MMLQGSGERFPCVSHLIDVALDLLCSTGKEEEDRPLQRKSKQRFSLLFEAGGVSRRDIFIKLD